ncbi:hypothetical protein M752DRAFT_267063 [Aspergillus phoenicis ATCC 13157]|uniref:Uncharacterized protein n=1 Tax=Aspergillus phoenicis ATCC 13157 TaxID=1353007 RepID=A0A370PH92_ASPPH|nr:hypothetical protein M752DRAFT_267063 [Aspergillus phoenicis ATCC 13157]
MPKHQEHSSAQPLGPHSTRTILMILCCGPLSMLRRSVLIRWDEFSQLSAIRAPQAQLSSAKRCLLTRLRGALKARKRLHNMRPSIMLKQLSGHADQTASSYTFRIATYIKSSPTFVEE